MLKDFIKIKIEVDNNIGNKNRFIYNNNNICNLKMGGECFIFFECEKNILKLIYVWTAIKIFTTQ